MNVDSKNSLGNYINSPLPYSENQELISNNSNDLLPLFQKAMGNFENIYESAPTLVKDLSSHQFSLTIKKAEDFLLIAERISAQTRSPEMQTNSIKMRQQFKELFKMIPAGPSVLFQCDIDKIKKLSEIPTNEKYNSKCGEYYEPKTCPNDIISHFQNFNNRNGYPGTSVSMKRDDFYGGYESRMMTLVGFTYKIITSPKLHAFINYFFEKEEDKDELKDSLEKLASEKVSEWNFENFEVIFPEDMQGTIKQRLQNENKYRCHIIFFHKKVENDPENAISSIEPLVQENISPQNSIQSSPNPKTESSKKTKKVGQQNKENKKISRTKFSNFLHNCLLYIKMAVLSFFQFLKEKITKVFKGQH